MKLLTTEEVASLVPVGRVGHSSIIRQNAFKLGVGEVLWVSDSDWKAMKYAKGTSLGSITAHKKMRFSARKHTFGDEKGWAVKRKK